MSTAGFPTPVPSFGLIESEHKHIEVIARELEAVANAVFYGIYANGVISGNVDGGSAAAGTTPRTLTWTAGNVTLTGNAGGSSITLPVSGTAVVQASPVYFATGNATIQSFNGTRRTAPYLTQNSTVVIGTTGATTGQIMKVYRPTGNAYTLMVMNGGAGAGILMTMTASKKATATTWFDGTNWALVESYQES